MKTVTILAALCLMFVLMSGITPASRKPVFQIATPMVAGAAQDPAATDGRKRAVAGQARWLRVVPGLFR